MAVGGENKDNDLCIVNLIYQAVLLSNTSTPRSSFVASKRFGMACARAWVVSYLV